MQKYISADWVFPVSSGPIKNGVIGYFPDGEIGSILTPESAMELGITDIEQYKGVIVPGFVNTHCHLELSHMRNKIAEKTGLPNFIKGILAQRQQTESEIIEAMESADQEMFDNGIVAVGDIANLLISKSIKLKSKIYYHTFVEVFGFNRPSKPIIEAGLQLKNDFKPLKASVVPHAPYSVSSTLFDEIILITEATDIVSIHNQETDGENELFETGTGSFADFFAELGIAQSEAHHSGKNAIRYYLPQLPKNVNTLLVHNTMSKKADIDFAKATHQQLYWCLCPNANLYIEGVLPDVDLFREENVKITIGTDSLASNHHLSILGELLTLQENKAVPFDELLKWATLNGAEFLGIEGQYGSLEKGKKPGLILLDLDSDNKIKTDIQLKRLF